MKDSLLRAFRFLGLGFLEPVVRLAAGEDTQKKCHSNC